MTICCMLSGLFAKNRFNFNPFEPACLPGKRSYFVGSAFEYQRYYAKLPVAQRNTLAADDYGRMIGKNFVQAGYLFVVFDKDEYTSDSLFHGTNFWIRRVYNILAGAKASAQIFVLFR